MTIIQKTIKAKIIADIYSYLAEAPNLDQQKIILEDICNKYFENPRPTLVEELRLLIHEMAQLYWAEKTFDLEFKKQKTFKKIKFLL